jgi:hypothetical protein
MKCDRIFNAFSEYSIEPTANTARSINAFATGFRKFLDGLGAFGNCLGLVTAHFEVFQMGERAHRIAAGAPLP